MKTIMNKPQYEYAILRKDEGNYDRPMPGWEQVWYDETVKVCRREVYPDVQLTLTHEEAQVLHRMLGKIGGETNGPRKMVESVWYKLNALGYPIESDMRDIKFTDGYSNSAAVNPYIHWK